MASVAVAAIPVLDAEAARLQAGEQGQGSKSGQAADLCGHETTASAGATDSLQPFAHSPQPPADQALAAPNQELPKNSTFWLVVSIPSALTPGTRLKPCAITVTPSSDSSLGICTVAVAVGPPSISVEAAD